jgi:hypothetical protein
MSIQSQHWVSSRIRTLELRQEVWRQGSVEVIRDDDATLLGSEAPILSALTERYEPGYRASRLGDDDFLPGCDTPEQSREVRLRLMNVHRRHALI